MCSDWYDSMLSMSYGDNPNVQLWMNESRRFGTNTEWHIM